MSVKFGGPWPPVALLVTPVFGALGNNHFPVGGTSPTSVSSARFCRCLHVSQPRDE